MQTQHLFRQHFRLPRAGHPRGNLQLLPIFDLVVSGNAGDALALCGILVPHPAGCILRVRRTRPDLIPGIGPVPAPDGQNLVLGFIFRLIEEHENLVGCLEGDARFMAEPAQKGNVACPDLLHPGIIRIDGRFVHTDHPAVCGHLIGNSGQCVPFPRL